MKKLILKHFRRETHRDPKQHAKDVDRIVCVLLEHGHEVTRQEVTDAWHDYSDVYYAAGWLILPESNEDLWKDIETVFDIVEEVET